MRLQLQRYLLTCRVRCRRATHFLESMPATELADRKAEYCFLACAWRITPQLPSLRIRAWRERMSGNALARACMVSVPWSCQVDASVSIVVSHPRSHDRRCGVDPTTVPPAPPLSPSSPQNLAYAFERSRERRGGTVAPRAQRTLGAARPPLGLLSCGCLEDGVTIHMGIIRSRYERSFAPIPSRRFVCLCFYRSAPTLLETLVQSAAFRCGS
jgi:hypothetical protein